ncbi:MAG: adenosine kinase [Bdellovibrionales bacterium]|nr:adenosine kinase [Bdellovibrionales bacterium]
MDSFYRDPHRDRDSFQVPILRRMDGDYPYNLEVRVSRFFKIKGRTFRGPTERPLEGNSIADQMNQPTVDLLRRWGQDFNYSEGTVQSLIAETRGVDALRKTHIGFRLDDTYWAGLDLFDGSSTLRLFDEMGKLDIVNTPSYLVTSETGRAAAIHAKKVAEEKNVKTSITLSDPGVVGFFKDGFKEMIGDGVDLLFCNEAEALSFTDTDNLEAAMEALKKHAGTLAVTRGPDGARLWDGEQYIEIEAPKVDAKDTNGAGDLFAGAFLYGLTHGHSFFESGKLACHCSSRLVTEFGARLEKDTIKQVYSEVFN